MWGGQEVTNMSQHTPGPWTVRKGAIVQVMASVGPVAQVYNRDENARLIAAAPRLYEEVVQAHKTLCGCSSGENCGAPSLFEAMGLVNG